MNFFKVAALGMMSVGGVSCSMMPSTPSPDPAEAKLIAAAQKAASAQEQLFQLEQARTPRQTSTYIDLKDVPENLKKPLSLTWDGPLEPALRKIAQQMGYALKIVGRAPATPLLVHVSVHQKPAILLIRELGHQARGLADVHIRHEAQLVEICYVPRLH